MSLQSQLIRLARNVGALNADTNAIFEALRAKGVDVPADAQLSDVADLIESIEVAPSTVNIGGRDYPVVQIGNQLWMAENLDYAFNGLVVGQSGISSSESRANYYQDNELDYGVDGTYKCGLLYNWIAVEYMEIHKSELFPGWHIPSVSDWDSIIDEYGGSSLASTEFKSENYSVTSGFPSNWKGTNSSGLNILPSGYKDHIGFSSINQLAFIWTSTQKDSNTIYSRGFNSGPSMHYGEYSKYYQFAVRLVRDLS